MWPHRRPLLALGIGLALLFSASPMRAQQTCDTGNYSLSTPTHQFEDHGDGTVTDQKSKLMWMRCSSGQSWFDARCTGPAAKHSWQSAQAAASTVNQDGSFFYNDWRVPLVRELATIAERQCENPRINLSIFPDTPAGVYWISSTRRGVTAQAQKRGVCAEFRQCWRHLDT